MARESVHRNGAAQSTYPEPEAPPSGPYPELWPDESATLPRSGHGTPSTPLTPTIQSYLNGWPTGYNGFPSYDQAEDDDDDQESSSEDPAHAIRSARGLSTVTPESWPEESIRFEDAEDEDPLINPSGDLLDSIEEILGDNVADFTRGSGRGRPRGRGRGGRGGKKRGWKQLLAGTTHDPKRPASEEPRARGRGRGGGRGRGKRQFADPGPKFKKLLGRANEAFLGGDLTTAGDLAREANKLNPEIFQVHSLLSEILRAQGHEMESAYALVAGSSVMRTTGIYMASAKRLLQAAGDDPTTEVLRTAISQLGLALAKENSNVTDSTYEIRTQKYQIYKKLGEFRQARRDCRNILGIWPDDITHLREYAELSAQLMDQAELYEAKQLYDKGFELHDHRDTFGDEDEDPWSHLNIYLELCDLIGQPFQGLIQGRRLARWFLGRKDETFWGEIVDNDCEWDFDNSRRAVVGHFQQGKASTDLEKYGNGLPIEIRVKFGVFRIKMGVEHYPEALRHFRPLMEYVDLIDEYYDIFYQVAKSLRAAGYVKEAVEFFHPLRSLRFRLGEDQWMEMATCYYVNLRKEDAIECFEQVVNFKGDQYAKASSLLAKLYEDAGDTVKAVYLCNELIKLGRRDLLDQAQIKLITPPAPATLPEGKESSNRPGLPPPDIMARLSAPVPVIKPTPERPYIPGRPLKLLLPAGLNGDISALGLASGGPKRPLPQLPSTETPAKVRKKRTYQSTKQKGRKKSAVEALVGDYATDTEAEPGDDSEEPPVKRPRLQKQMARKPTVREQRKADIQNAEARVLSDYGILCQEWPAMLSGQDSDANERWLIVANSLRDEFVSIKPFFPTDRSISVAAPDEPNKWMYRRVESYGSADTSVNLPQAHHNIAMAEWHRIFGDLAILYVRLGEQDKCYSTIQDVLFAANVFYRDRALDMASFGVAIYCALSFNDGGFLIELARKLIFKGDGRAGMTFQLFAALTRCSFASNWFSSGPSQKFMLRMVKQTDYMVMTPAVRDSIDWNLLESGLRNRVKSHAGEFFELDAGILTTYGHMVAVANHSSSSLPYYYRALALQPKNICLNLSLAAMWVQLSMKRQTENRHAGVQQGLAFLDRYYDFRTRSGKAIDQQEAEYNRARMWHFMNLTHLAVPGYLRALELSAAVRTEAEREREEKGFGRHEDEEGSEEDIEDFAAEAAFALQGIYSLAGNAQAARDVTEKWLVI